MFALNKQVYKGFKFQIMVFIKCLSIIHVFNFYFWFYLTMCRFLCLVKLPSIATQLVPSHFLSESNGTFCLFVYHLLHALSLYPHIPMTPAHKLSFCSHTLIWLHNLWGYEELLQQKVSMYAKWFHWILSEFIGCSE